MRTPLVLLLCALTPILTTPLPAQPLAPPDPAPTVAATLLHPSTLLISVPEASTSALPDAPQPQSYPPYPCYCSPPPPRSPFTAELIVIGVIALIFLISAAVH